MLNIYVSSNVCSVEDLDVLIEKMPRLSHVKGAHIGVELFPEFQTPIFTKFLQEHMEALSSYPSSLHGPYFCTEHTAAKGTEEYEAAVEYFTKSLELGRSLKSKYIVYHHNNCAIASEDKEKLLAVSNANLLELNEIAETYGVPIVVENAGVNQRNNVILDQEEFIKLAMINPNKILIDIGHAYANGWDIAYVIETLKGKIVAYHLHNNDGTHDDHDSLENGTYDMDEFISCYNKFTPDADLVVEYSQNYLDQWDVLERDILWLIRNINKK